MSLYTLAFAAKRPEPIFQVITELAQSCFVSISAIRKWSEQEGTFEPLSCSFEEAFGMLLKEEIVSLLCKTEQLPGVNVIINRPFILDDASPLWYAELDGLHAHEYKYFHHVRGVSGIQFVAFSFEDSIDFSSHSLITEENFPWNDWRLIEAVVAKSDGDTTELEVRRGPAFYQHGNTLGCLALEYRITVANSHEM